VKNLYDSVSLGNLGEDAFEMECKYLGYLCLKTPPNTAGFDFEIRTRLKKRLDIQVKTSSVNMQKGQMGGLAFRYMFYLTKKKINLNWDFDYAALYFSDIRKFLFVSREDYRRRWPRGKITLRKHLLHTYKLLDWDIFNDDKEIKIKGNTNFIIGSFKINNGGSQSELWQSQG
jgi:hypothetical protein